MSTATIERAARKYRVLGENDDASECSCCGRQGLKRVVWMQALDENGEEMGIPVPFGRVCASKAAGWGYGSSDRSGLERKINAEIKAEYKRLADGASAAIARLEADGKIVRARVAFARAGAMDYSRYGIEFSFGSIFTLPDDAILAMVPAAQVEGVRAAKDRRNAAYPVCRWMEESLSMDALRALLA